MNKTALIVKSNALIETSYRLTLIEQRVLLACISQVRRDEVLTDQIMYSVSAQEVSELCGSDPKTAYRDLKAAALKLKRREVRITQEANGKGRLKKTLIASWVQSITYSGGDGIVRLRFNHDILPYLSELNRCFTSYNLKNIVRMSSTYGVRIYELLVQWGEHGERDLSISWLREALQLEGKYKEIGDFKRRVLDPAIKDLNKNSDLWVKVTQRKTGKKVTHLKFEFGLKNEHKANEKNQTKLSGTKVFGVDKAIVDKEARRGETYEQAALRIKKESLKSNQNIIKVSALQACRGRLKC
jgi:plasmid replication initiation protein